jgi:hypothetical protein
MRRAASGFVLGFHGCDASVAEKLLGNTPFRLSQNEYDWLGEGAYFWENDPLRGLQWAEVAKERGRPVPNPTVVGAVIDLGYCLDLTTQASLDVIKTAHDGLERVSKAIKRPMPRNIDELRRPLDCSVLNYLYESMPAPKFQTVRGVFIEGDALYPGAFIKAKTHVQLAVRDLACIRGVFRVSDDELRELKQQEAARSTPSVKHLSGATTRKRKRRPPHR